jgi:hypothetical protein
MPIKKSIEDCQKLAEERGGKCLSAKYVNSKTKIEWECKFKHRWFAIPNNVFNYDSWCPDCKINLGEQLTRTIIEKLFQRVFKKVRPDWLEGLELDGYNDDLLLAYEYQGIQHYTEDKHFHRTDTAFAEQQERDAKKKTLCEYKIALIIVPYWEFDKGIRNLVTFILNRIHELDYDDFIQKEIDINNIALNAQLIQEAYEKWPGGDEKFAILSDAVKRKGYTITNNTWAGRRYQYDIICNKGHNYQTSGDTLLDPRGRGCPHPDCNGKPIITDDVIRAFAVERGFEFTGKYDGGSSKPISFKCIVGHEVQMSWDNFKQYKNCRSCFGLTSDETKLTALHRYAERNGGKLMATQYTNMTTEMPFICACSNKFKLTPSELMKGKWCECKK